MSSKKPGKAGKSSKKCDYNVVANVWQQLEADKKRAKLDNEQQPDSTTNEPSPEDEPLVSPENKENSLEDEPRISPEIEENPPAGQSLVPEVCVEEEEVMRLKLNDNEEEDFRITDGVFLKMIKFMFNMEKEIVNFKNMPLKEHQIVGIKFMFNMVFPRGMSDLNEAGGGILAHSMGLGKTRQVVVLTDILFKKLNQLIKNVVIFAPKTLLGNWKTEFLKWIPTKYDVINIAQYEKNPKERLEAIIKWKFGCQSLNYEILKTFDTSLKRMITSADIIFVYEAHIIKSPTHQARKIVDKGECKRRILLTGTPLSKSIRDLYYLVEFAKPGELGDYESFRKKYEIVIEQGYLPDATERQKTAKVKALNAAAGLTNTFIHRRDTSIISDDLPNKFEFILHCSLTEKQELLYTTYLEHAKRMGQKNELSAIAFLSKINAHPFVALNKIRSKGNEFEHSWYETVSSQCKIPSSRQQFDDANIVLSCKNKVLLRIYKECQEKSEKLIVFSEYVETLIFIEGVVKKVLNKRLNRDYVCINGDATPAQREKSIEKFDEEQQCNFLLITKAVGSCGLNLVSSNRMIIFEPSWTPTTDDQAVGRIYRMGQKSDVFIYRFVTSGTNEERIFENQIKKSVTSGAVVDSKALETKQLDFINNDKNQDKKVEHFKILF